MTNDTSPLPILFVDVDGVISLFGFPSNRRPPGTFHWVDGIAHCIGTHCGERLRRLEHRFELVWATGWEEKANEYLPFLLEMARRDYPVLTFDGRAIFGSAHWKLEAIEEFARGRPAAWIDDSIDRTCRAWADRRPEPTLLVETDAPVGITEDDVGALLAWADELAS